MIICSINLIYFYVILGSAYPFSKENELSLIMTENNKEALFANITLVSCSEITEDVLCSRYLPLNFFLKQGENSEKIKKKN